MTEKEKRKHGLLYDANNNLELEKELLSCKNLCLKYNKIKSCKYKKQQKVLKKLLGYIGCDCYIQSPFWCDYGYNIFMGNNFYSNHNCVILDAAEVVFGNNVFVGPNCGFYTAGHPNDYPTRNKGLEYAYPITVGDNVWIGGNVTVLPGVSIGNNVVIGAGSLVNKNIPDNVLAAGNPCKIIKTLK